MNCQMRKSLKGMERERIANILLKNNCKHIMKELATGQQGLPSCHLMALLPHRRLLTAIRENFNVQGTLSLASDSMKSQVAIT